MSSSHAPDSTSARRAGQQALAGVKVLDFGWALVGSLTSKILADYGAEVIRIESRTRPDLSRISRNVSVSKAGNPDDKPWFVHLNTSKYSFTINLKHPRAKEVMERLILWADVINENFTPGTLTRLGLDYDRASELNPGIIMVSGSAYGQTGPLAHEWGIDGTGAAWSGYLSLTGWPDREPVGPQMPFGDTIVPYLNVVAIMAALDYKRRTGQGQHLDTAMIDVATHQSAPALLDWQINGRLQTRAANRIPNAAPHGVFPCLGEDRWCAIAVFREEEWQALLSVMGRPAWALDSRFSTLALRKEHEDELEACLAGWTREHRAEDLMHMLQQAGVPAGVAQSAEDLLERDPQMKIRQLVKNLTHPVLGKIGHPSPTFILSQTTPRVRTAPCLGEHVELVCREMLGMSESEFEELKGERVFV
jgi:benzylsuccinate CoA-transferase BbsF subunit